MTALTSNFSDTRLSHLLSDIAQGNKVLWRSTQALALGFVVCLVLIAVDHRLLNGVDVWDKPAKFFLSLVVQMATVSWALSQLPEAARKTKGVERAVWVMTIAAWAELTYISFRAANGLASHFDYSTPLSSIAYGLMGLGAVSITSSAGFIGWRLWQHRQLGLWTEAAGLGLLVGMVLGTLAGGYLSQQHGHWVGGELSDAHGLGFFGWSGTGGDLRIAHFVGLHAAQFIPFAAVSGSRTLVYSTALFSIFLTVFTFVLAVMGLPLFAA
jgi:hypothetical protein